MNKGLSISIAGTVIIIIVMIGAIFNYEIGFNQIEGEYEKLEFIEVEAWTDEELADVKARVEKLMNLKWE